MMKYWVYYPCKKIAINSLYLLYGGHIKPVILCIMENLYIYMNFWKYLQNVLNFESY